MATQHRLVKTVFGGDYGEDVDTSRWVVIYPPYIDSTRKESEVRNNDEVATCRAQMHAFP